MAEDPRFLLHFNTLAKFNSKLNDPNDDTINPNRHLVFIKDSEQIWCRGKFYSDNIKLSDFTDYYNDWELTQTDSEKVTITLKGKEWNETSRTWDSISKSFDLVPATSTIAGLMSAEDKRQVDIIDTANFKLETPTRDSTTVTINASHTDVNLETKNKKTSLTLPESTVDNAGIMSALDKITATNLRTLGSVTHLKDDNLFTTDTNNVKINYDCIGTINKEESVTEHRDKNIPVSDDDHAGIITGEEHKKLNTDIPQEIKDVISKLLVSDKTTAAEAAAILADRKDGYKTLVEVAATLETFLEDEDVANTTINKWKEIENFLSGITDTETLIGVILDAINELDVSDTSVANNFVTAVSETDGKISVTRARPTAANVSNTKITGSNTLVEVSGTDVQTAINDLATAIKTEETARTNADSTEATNRDTAITNAINNLDAVVTSTDGTNVLVKVTETDGKVSDVNITTDNTINRNNIKAGTGISLTLNTDDRNTTINHSNSVTEVTTYQGTSDKAGETAGEVTVISGVKYDGQGHITGVLNKKITLNNTTYSAGDGIKLDSTTFKHTNAVTAATNVGGNAAVTPNYGDTFNVPYFSYDALGHITASGTHTVKIPASDNTDSQVTSAANHYSPTAVENSKLTASASGAEAAWSIDVVKGITINRDDKGHVTGVSVESGKIPANPNTDTQSDWNVTDTNSKAFIKNKPTSLSANGGNADTVNGHSVNSDVPANAKFTDTTYSVFTRSSGTGLPGNNGLVPTPTYEATETRFLKADGTWSVPTGTYTLPTASSTTLGGVKIGDRLYLSDDEKISVNTNLTKMSSIKFKDGNDIGDFYGSECPKLIYSNNGYICFKHYSDLNDPESSLLYNKNFWECRPEMSGTRIWPSGIQLYSAFRNPSISLFGRSDTSAKGYEWKFGLSPENKDLNIITQGYSGTNEYATTDSSYTQGKLHVHTKTKFGQSVGFGTDPDEHYIANFKLEVSFENYNAFRLKARNYGTIFRNDGDNTYILLTASGDIDGMWNNLRPFTINNSSGVVTIENLKSHTIKSPTLYTRNSSEKGGYLQSSDTGSLIIGAHDNYSGSSFIELTQDKNIFTYRPLYIKHTLKFQNNSSKVYNVTTDSNGILNFVNNDGNVTANLDLNGNINLRGTCTNGSITSDQRFKKNIKPIENASEIISKLNPISFNWNDKAKEYNSALNNKKNYGLIAQEVEELLPELVNSIYGEYKSLNYQLLISILIKANQELDERNKDLENRLSKIEKLLNL